MGRTFFRSSKSIRDSFVGFAPVPKPGIVLDPASGTTIIPAVISFTGIASIGMTFTVNYETSVDAASNVSSTPLTAGADSEGIAIVVAAFLTAETNLTASAVGPNVEVLASGTATTVLINSVTSKR